MPMYHLKERIILNIHLNHQNTLPTDVHISHHVVDLMYGIDGPITFCLTDKLGHKFFFQHIEH